MRNRKNGQNRDWFVLYQDTILESDANKLRALLPDAQKAIQRRIQRLEYAGLGGTPERDRLTAAFHYLELLRTTISAEDEINGLSP